MPIERKVFKADLTRNIIQMSQRNLNLYLVNRNADTPDFASGFWILAYGLLRILCFGEVILILFSFRSLPFDYRVR